MKTPSIALALVLSVVACKQRNETTAPPAPTPVTTTAPPVAPPPPAMPVAVVDAGVVMPGPNAMATPDAGAATGLAPGAAPPTGAPPAAPAAPPVVATADAGVAPAPAAPATAAAAPSGTRPSTRNGTTTTPINIPGVNGGPPVTVQQGNGQTRVNVGGVQVVIPGVGGN